MVIARALRLRENDAMQRKRTHQRGMHFVVVRFHQVSRASNLGMTFIANRLI
jgi:hypothetical protein